MLEFKLNMYFQEYKDKVAVSLTKFREDFTKNMVILF